MDEGKVKQGASTSENMEDALTSFWEQWQRELKLSSESNSPRTRSKPADGAQTENDPEDIETKAKHLFLKGVELEEQDKLYEAIQFYMRAVRLVPDIEFRLYNSYHPKDEEKIDPDNNSTDSKEKCDANENKEKCEEDEDDNDNEEIDLFVKLSRIVNRNQRVCFPKFEQTGTHISALPMEIILYILRWVVSSDLDLRSLEMFSRVCRGFYVSARDTEIWRLVCVRIWGLNCHTYAPNYRSWRDMYLKRPRLRFNGCYISKTSYIRYGENAFQDRFYRPWYLVKYFRYLRFFPEGKVLMLTSTDDAQNCVNSLRSRVPWNPSVLIGHYRLHNNCVTLVLKKQDSTVKQKRKEAVMFDSGEQTFHVEFEIQNHCKKLNSQLKWLSYIVSTKYKTGNEVRICLKEPSPTERRVSVLESQYPSFKFSRVKSYTQESEAPL